MKKLDKDIDRTVSLLLKTTSNALTEKLQQLETEKAQLSFLLDDLESNHRQNEYTVEEIKTVLAQVRKLLKAGTLETVKSVVDKFVSKVIVNTDGVVVHFNFFPDFTIKPEELIEKDCPVTEHGIAQEQSFSLHQSQTNKADEIGGADPPLISSTNPSKKVDEIGGAGVPPKSSTLNDDSCLIVSIPRNSKHFQLHFANNLQSILTTR